MGGWLVPNAWWLEKISSTANHETPFTNYQ